MLIEIDQLKIELAKQAATESNKHLYQEVLDAARIMSREGLEPVFLYDVERGAVFITSRLAMENKLH